jgi:hypothetical protein
MLFSRLAQSAAALFLSTVGLAAPIHAQNNKQIISGTWYEDRAQASNTSTAALFLTFAQTPTNQFLNITNVNCAITLSTQEVLTGLSLEGGTVLGYNDLGRPLSIRGSVAAETSGLFKYYSIATNQVYYKFGPGRYPLIEIDIGTTGSASNFANCVIVGNLTDN